MGNQLPVPFEYPRKPTWEFLSDPELYFSSIPRDIISYVLFPYLANPQCRDPVNQGWLEKPIYHGGYFVNTYHLTCLQGGDLVYCDEDDYRFVRVNPKQAGSETVYGFPPTVLTTFDYDYPNDTLYLYDEDATEETGKYLEVPDISQVYEDDFEAFSVDESINNQLKLGLFTLYWEEDSWQVDVVDGIRLVRSYQFPEIFAGGRPTSVSYYGGYLLVTVPLSDGRDRGNVILVYRLIE